MDPLPIQKLIEDISAALARPEVTEFVVAAGRLPSARVRGAYEPTGSIATPSDLVFQLLVKLGGSRYLESLGTEPVSWRTRLPASGAVVVMALERDGVLQARIAPQRDTAAAATSGVPSSPRGDARAAAATLPAHPQAAMSPTLPAIQAARVAPERDRTFELDLDRSTPLDLAADAKSARASVQRAFEPLGSTFSPDGSATSPRVSVPTPPPARVPSVPVDSGTFEPLDALLAEAREKGASDLHVVSDRPALFRVAGEITPSGDPLESDAVASMLLSAIPEHLRAGFDANGSCDFSRTHPTLGRFRVNVTRQRTGLKGSFRLIGREVPTLESLGLPGSIAQATHHHQGLIVLTGPTGHGKTTTLAAIVDIINRDTTHHVITVEDPIEYVHPRKRAMISQREVGTHTKSFLAALKASLREDPDVVVVGELRDTETVRMALSASETGHLVIGTMNTPSAAKTIDRIIDLFPPGDQAQVRSTLAGGLRLIVSQRLVRTADGKRMTAAVEVLPGSVALWNLIRDSKTYQIPSLQQRGKGMGIVRLDDSLADLVRSGQITLETARTAAESPDELIAAVRGAPAVAAAPTAGARG